MSLNKEQMAELTEININDIANRRAAADDSSTDTTLATIQAMMETQGITFEDVNKMIKLAIAGPRKEHKKKEPEIVYKGVATYTCDTCEYEFDSTFNTNKRNMHVKYPVPMCHECDARLLDCTKEELISKIRFAYHHQHHQTI